MKQDRHPWLDTYHALGKDWQQVPVIPPLTLSGYVRQHAQLRGDREALVFAGQGISYRQLDQLADRMARSLADAGCKRGDVLGIQLPNIPQYVVGLVAAARLGMVVSSISPLLTAPEVRHQCQDAGVRVLLGFAPLYAHTVAPVRAELPTLAHVIITGPTDSLDPAARCDEADASQVHSFNQWLAAADCEPVPELGDIDQVMYLQYTGGTTGLPKGAQLTARNIFINNAQADVFYGFGVGEEVVASAFPLFHIGGAAVLFNALRQAATFFLIPDPRDLAQFCREMQQRPPTVIAAVPALYQMLLNEPAFTGQDFSQLRLAVSGAAPFSEADIARLEAVIGKQRFCEVYGMTETSPVQTLNPAERLKPGFVGIPLPGTEVRIVDPESHERMPSGEPGEIIVAGPQVMSGYLNLPEATDKALHQIDGKTWMFTGDIGFMDEDGYVRVCDRSKDMLIVGGYKVFSVEIENKLLSLPDVEMCAVVGRPDPDRAGNEIVQLHVQKAAGYTGDNDTLAESILGYCRKNMAPYKVPREIFFPDAIPLTSVGKIDKKALRQA